MQPNVTTAVSITGSGYVQLVLKDQDGGDGTDSNRLAALIKADIDAGNRHWRVCVLSLIHI